MTIAAARDGVRVQIGKQAPQTFPLTREVADEERSEEAAPAPADAEVAQAEGGAGRDRSAAHADDPRGAERAEAGDRRDRAGEDLAGTLLPAGGAGAEGDPDGDGAWDLTWEAAGDDHEALAAGGEGEGAGGGQAAAGEALVDDAQGAAAGPDEELAGAAELGERWQERFAALEREESGQRYKLTDLVERSEHPLSWPRKLAGETALSDAGAAGVSDVHDAAKDARGDRGAVRDDPPGAHWSAHADRGGGEAQALDGAVPQPAQPGGGRSAGGALAEEAWAQVDAGGGAEAAGGERAAEEREPAPAGESGHDRPADDGRGRDPARAGADGAAEEEGWRGRRR